ncbi:hypothetical protein F4777DRAFT_555767 [Nemania sp. FL0916]|nr:hypothetical protein F4777DRAFT_555767 [Nemania sp. FL0916]
MGSIVNNTSDQNDAFSAPAFNITRIAIVGAGPSGLAAAKYLLAEGFSSEKIDIYEQQAEVGGVWNYNTATSAQPLRVPLTDAHAPPELPVYPDDLAAEDEEEEGEEEDKYADYVFDSDEEASTAPGSGACSLPPVARQKKEKRPPVFPNPMYDDLHTNIPHTLMRYSDLGFHADEIGARKGKGTHEDCEIFPSRQVVQEYLVEYARDVRQLIRFSAQVTNISLQTPSPSATTAAASTAQQPRIQEKWTLQSTNLVTNASNTETYDAVVVASGHYSTPYIPAAAPGISEFASTHPGVISHSKTYRAAAAFAGKRVVVVGSGPSGLDIAAQISAVCKPPLIVCARSPVSTEMCAHLGVGGDDNNDNNRVRVVGPIKRFLDDERGIEVGPTPSSPSASSSKGEAGGRGGEIDKEESTEKISDIDAIVFCTGYLYTFPFLPSSSFPASTPPLITSGRRVHGVARHFLHTRHPTLVFPGLPYKIIPFPLAEAQAAVFSRLWANRLPLPSQEELEVWEKEDEEGKGLEGQRVAKREKSFHTFPKGGDALYINALHDWAARALDEGAGGKGKGKEPPSWGPEELWQRSIYAQAKMQFEKTGRKARTLLELGLSRETSGEEDTNRLLDGAKSEELRQNQIDLAG